MVAENYSILCCQKGVSWKLNLYGAKRDEVPKKRGKVGVEA